MSDFGRNVLWAIVVIIVGLLAYYWGNAHGAVPSSSTTATTTPATSTSVATGSSYYSNPAQWQTYNDSQAGYSISFPIDFSVEEPTSIAPTTDWLTNNVSQWPGIKTFTLTVPSAFEPQTNFVDATLTIGYSQNDKALAGCLLAQDGEATSSTRSVNNASFTVFTSGSPGAGQLYQTTSYRTTHAGACYAVEYTIHSAQLGNYPSSYDLQQFDQQQIDGVLDQIVGTFSFS